MQWLSQASGREIFKTYLRFLLYTVRTTHWTGVGITPLIIASALCASVKSPVLPVLATWSSFRGASFRKLIIHSVLLTGGVCSTLRLCESGALILRGSRPTSVGVLLETKLLQNPSSLQSSRPHRPEKEPVRLSRSADCVLCNQSGGSVLRITLEDVATENLS